MTDLGLIAVVSTIWLIIGVVIGSHYLDNRDAFVENTDNLYVLDIVIILVCLPCSLIAGFILLIVKLIQIKIK